MKFIVIALLLASPLLAAMGTYQNLKSTSVGDLTYKYGYALDGAQVKLYLEISGASLDTEPTAGCLYVGVPASDSTGTNWKNGDVGLYPYSSTAPKTSNPKDCSCSSTETANVFCNLQGFTTAETNQNWGFSPSASVDADKVAWTAGTIKWDLYRRITSQDDNVDRTWTNSLLVYFNPSATCVTADGQLPASGSIPNTVGKIDGPIASSSFGAISLVSVFAFILAFFTLN